MTPLEQLDRDGFTILLAVFTPAEVAEMADSLDDAFARSDAGVLRSARAIYGARNLLQLWPAAATVWRKPVLVDFVLDALGPEAGVVRGLFFDKPPEQSWTLPPHRDLTIAVKDNSSPGLSFSNPTTKAGVPHVAAPTSLLEKMLTLRVHLDPMTADNGPLTLIPGSHRGESAADPVTPLGPAGDVLAMRPLVVHGSRHTAADNALRRRIVHLELTGVCHLPEGMKWHDYIRVR